MGTKAQLTVKEKSKKRFLTNVEWLTRFVSCSCIQKKKRLRFIVTS